MINLELAGPKVYCLAPAPSFPKLGALAFLRPNRLKESGQIPEMGIWPFRRLPRLYTVLGGGFGHNRRLIAILRGGNHLQPGTHSA